MHHKEHLVVAVLQQIQFIPVMSKNRKLEKDNWLQHKVTQASGQSIKALMVRACIDTSKEYPPWFW